MALSPEEREELITHLVKATRTVERCRSIIRPLGAVNETIVELLEMDPDLRPELMRLHELVIEAGETAESIVAVVNAKWDVRWGD